MRLETRLSLGVPCHLAACDCGSDVCQEVYTSATLALGELTIMGAAQYLVIRGVVGCDTRRCGVCDTGRCGVQSVADDASHPRAPGPNTIKR